MKLDTRWAIRPIVDLRPAAQDRKRSDRAAVPTRSLSSALHVVNGQGSAIRLNPAPRNVQTQSDADTIVAIPPEGDRTPDEQPDRVCAVSAICEGPVC